MEALNPQDEMATNVTSRLGSHSRVWPLATLAGAAGVGAYLYANDPSAGGAYLRCPLHSLTGLWCPGCGMTRAAFKLVHGEVVAALGANLFIPVVAVLLAAMWWDWWRSGSGGSKRLLARVPTAAWITLVGAFVAFGVMRNFTAFDALAP